VKLNTSRLGRTVLGLTTLLTALSACSPGSLTNGGVGAAEFGLAPAAPAVAPGEKLQFAVTPADVGAITWAVAEPTGGTIDATGQYTAPDAEGAYTVIAAAAVGTRSTAVHVKRNVPAPVIASFTAAPSQIVQGGSATLSWSVSGATSVSIDDGTGPATVVSPKVVTPSATTTYTLVATNRAGSVSANVVLTVTAAAPSTPPVIASQGAGTTYGASFLTGVTGGGAMPAWSSNVVTAACAGNGVTDDTACLQAAANAARDQQKPLVIPATSAFYAINGPFHVYTSVGGVGGMPTIKQTNTSGTYGLQKMIILAQGMTGWIYNLHLVGTFDGNPADAVTEHGHQIDVGTVNGVTIKDNLLENAMGDSISSDVAQYDGGTVGQNVLVDGNTMRNPYRCAVGFIYSQQNWVITNNLIDKQVNFVSGIDFEPENGGAVYHVEIAYNKFVMNNRTMNPDRGVDGIAISGWHVPSPPTATAGGDYYLHHNYGTFGTGFSVFGNGGWGSISQASNAEGSAVPN